MSFCTGTESVIFSDTRIVYLNRLLRPGKHRHDPRFRVKRVKVTGYVTDLDPETGILTGKEVTTNFIVCGYKKWKDVKVP